MCYYFDYTMRVDINFRKNLLEEKKYEIILIYDISYKTTLMDSMPLCIRFDEID